MTYVEAIIGKKLRVKIEMVKIVTSRMPEIEELIEVVKPRSEKEVKEIFPIKFESKEEKNNFKPLHLNDLYDVIKNSELEFDMSKYRRIVEETSMAIPEKGVDPVTWNNMCNYN